MKRWEVRVRTLTGGVDSYVRVLATDYVEAGERARQKAAQRFRNNRTAHLFGGNPKEWEVIWLCARDDKV